MQLASHELGKQLEEAVLNGTITIADAVRLFSRAILVSVLKSSDGNIAASARKMGVKRQSLTEMMQRRGNMWKISTHGRYYRHKPIPNDIICQNCLSVSASSSCLMCEGLSSILEHSTASLCKS